MGMLLVVAFVGAWLARGPGVVQTQTFAYSTVLPGLAVDAGTLGCGATLPGGCPTATTTVAVHGAEGSGVAISVEIADTSETRSLGLMSRTSLPELAGMLFVFPSDTTNGFWMKDTLIPLDIAYLSSEGEVLEIRDGVPLSLENLTPTQPYRFTLEVNGGWFERHGFGVGDRVDIPFGVNGP